MDNIVMICFASVLCTMTALNFIELRRIRKKMDVRPASSPMTAHADAQPIRGSAT